MAAANTQFAIAVHMMTSLADGQGQPMTSAQLSASVNTSPSFVRRILAMLSKAGLVRTVRGPSGSCSLARKAREISLLDVYRAVEAPRVFALHNYASEKTCRVSCHIKQALKNVQDDAQSATERLLAKRTLADVLADMYS